MKLWNRIRWKMAGLWADESGMGVVEVILIIVVLHCRTKKQPVPDMYRRRSC